MAASDPAILQVHMDGDLLEFLAEYVPPGQDLTVPGLVNLVDGAGDLSADLIAVLDLVSQILLSLGHVLDSPGHCVPVSTSARRRGDGRGDTLSQSAELLDMLLQDPLLFEAVPVPPEPGNLVLVQHFRHGHHRPQIRHL